MANTKLTLEEIFLALPLYSPIQVEHGINFVRELLTFAGSLDTYCSGCKQPATFRAIATEDAKRARQLESAMSIGAGQRNVSHWDQTEFSKLAMCTRDHRHVLRFYFIRDDKTVYKVGQFPSLADIEKPEMAKYAKILGDERRKELNRAIGLAANGVGIGSYAYLRRVFESLVEDAHKVVARTGRLDEEKYNRARMDERIRLLKSTDTEALPDFLVENAKMYSILSKGIHELSEDECLAHFDALRISIEVILDQKLDAIAKQERENAAKKAIAKIPD